MATSAQPQFRYTQTPSKVLHLRNLPWDCTEEELVELCKPFGKIVNTKCNVGANHNQAFVEFVDPNQAINMVTYFASSSDPAQIRGKSVYIQYSNRHEIVNNKSPGDVPGNVLLVTIEGVEATDVSIDVIHLVFSAFGFVHKIATFEKAAGFQALIQYSDATTASSARDSLDGRSIPRYLLPEHVNLCQLRISYSAHTDLNIKFQSHRSRVFSEARQLKQRCNVSWPRKCDIHATEKNKAPHRPHLVLSNTSWDYTNPYLPVNPTAMEGLLQPVVGPDGKKKEPESNVLLASIENAQYAVTVDTLHTVFSAFGTVQKIAIFEKNGGIQALVQYPDVTTAAVAKESLEGHCIYDGGYCKLHLTHSRHTDLNIKAYSDKSRDYTIREPGLLALHQASGIPSAATNWSNSQSAQLPPGSGFVAGGAIQTPASNASVSCWDPNLQPGRQTFISAPGTFPGQPYTTAVTAGYSAPLPQNAAPMRVTQPMHPENMPPGVHPYYSR